MRRRILSLCVILTTCLLSSYAQVISNPIVRKAETGYSLVEVNLMPDATVFVILDRFPDGGWVSFSPNFRIEYTNPKTGLFETKKIMRLTDLYGNELKLGRKYGISWLPRPYKNVYCLCFPGIPTGVDEINLIEGFKGGFEWFGISLTPWMRLASTEEEINKLIVDSKNPKAGIYEELSPGSTSNYRLAFIQTAEEAFFVYVSSTKPIGTWTCGEVKAVLRPTVSKSIYKADWYMADKSVSPSTIIFEGGTMKVIFDEDGSSVICVKMSDGTNSDADVDISGEELNMEKSSGTGFFLTKDGYIVTNHHVVEDAKTLRVSGINGDHTRSYNARVEIIDKQNDLAIIKIDDASFSGLSSIPYALKTTTANIGEDCFVLGYPLISTMGLDIKLTNGIISSKTGFQGNVADYQISAPIQPGNSGGPLFDKDGNIIGVVCAKHVGAENAGYAVKASYLRNLVELLPVTIALPESNLLKGKTLPQQVESASKAVCIIIVNGDISDVQ